MGILIIQSKMRILILCFFAVGIAQVKKVNAKNFNPECPTEESASACEDDCISENVNCVQNCVGNQECIRECSREYASCTDICPCYPGCYNGCPCSFDSDYCKSCEIRFENQHSICK